MHSRSLLPPLPEETPTNLHDVIFRGPGHEDIPDHVLHIDGISGEKRTRAEFTERVYDGATALGAPRDLGGLGLTSNDIVGILSDNCLDYMVLVNSLLVITTPFVPFSTYATAREIAECLVTSKATHIFVHACLLPDFLSVARKLSFPDDHIFILEGCALDTVSPPSFGHLIEKARHNKIPREPIREVLSDTLAYLIFSSGTSGLPKLVMITHWNLRCNIVQSALYLQQFNTEAPAAEVANIPRLLICLPFFHSYSLLISCLRSSLAPATQVILPRWDLDSVLSLIPKYRITHMPSIPSIIHKLVHSPQFEKIDRSSLVGIVSASAHLPVQLRDKMKKLIPTNSTIFQAYGMSECTLTVMLAAPPGLVNAPDNDIASSTGILLSGQEAMILRQDGTHCLPGEPGELFVKGGNVTPGYWNNSEATGQAFLPNGWLRTGDRFRADNNGLFWFEERVKDTLKVSGLQVSPTEIEDVIMSEPWGLVKDVAVAGVQLPGARTSDDQSPRAWIVLSPRGLQLQEEDVRGKLERWTKDNLSKHKWLRGGIQVVEELPKTPTGKTLRRVLQEQYASSSFEARL